MTARCNGRNREIFIYVLSSLSLLLLLASALEVTTMSTTTITNTHSQMPNSDYELQIFVKNKSPPPCRSSNGSSRKSLESLNDQAEDVTDGPGLPPPNTAVDQVVLERWNYPPENKLGIAATFYAFLVFGLNDASYGALIPYLERYYHLTYTVVSLIFLSPFLGYSAAALCNNAIHMRFGQRGIAIIAPSCRLITYLILCFHPPYPVIVVFFIFAGFGNGLEDAAWCAWTGNMVNANRVQGMCTFSFGDNVLGFQDCRLDKIVLRDFRCSYTSHIPIQNDNCQELTYIERFYASMLQSGCHTLAAHSNIHVH